MTDTHLWITGTSRADCAAAAAARQPDAAADCDRRLRGPYTGTGSVLRALVPLVHARRPGLTARHAIEILAAAPELTALIGPAPETLTSMAPVAERTRWYSRFRSRRIAHGIVDFLRAAAADGPLTLAFGSAGQADHTDQEFLSVALRRLDPGQVRLIVCTGPREPADGALRDALTAWCKRAEAPAAAAPGTARPGDAAAAFVDSDGTSDVPGEQAAYLAADPRVRARLHDERAARLQAREEYSLRLGAIPYHLEHGSDPAAARAAYSAAIWYCTGMAFYDAGLELAVAHRGLIDPGAEPEAWVAAEIYVCQSLAMLDRPAETESIYYDIMARTTNAHLHMNFSYALAILFTRLHAPDHKDHRRALGHVNTAIAIAGQLEDPDDRAFHTVFMSNGKALVQTHLGNLAESLRLVSDGIARLDQDLTPDRHRLHRSVLYHNRAQVLTALGRPEDALADYGRVIADDPHYPEYRFDRGNLLVKLGRLGEAVDDYTAAMAVTPPFPELYYNRGDARSAAGDAAGAMSDFRYVLDLEPDYLEARISLACPVAGRGRPAGRGRGGPGGPGGRPRRGAAALHARAGAAATWPTATARGRPSIARWNWRRS